MVLPLPLECDEGNVSPWHQGGARRRGTLLLVQGFMCSGVKGDFFTTTIMDAEVYLLVARKKDEQPAANPY